MNKKLKPWHLTPLVICITFSNPALAQQQELEAVIKQIEFKDDTIRSVFEWITKEIAYDPRMALLKTHTLSLTTSHRESVREVLATRKGTCFHYSRLFDALLRHLGYESYVIEGYVIVYERINEDIGHAWNAVRVGKQWLMFDPTWAAGYIDTRTAAFVRRYDPRWYANTPADFVRTHVPFDPLWQFVSAPLTHAQIRNGDFENNESGTFDFEDSLRVHQKQNELDRMQSEFARMKSGGIPNRLLKDELDLMEVNIRNRRNITLLDSGFDQIQQTLNYYNNYIAGKNRRFKNPEWSDEQLKAVPDAVEAKVSSMLGNIALIQSPSPNVSANIQILKKKADEISTSIKAESAFIARYLKTSKPLRFLVFRSVF